MLALVACDRGGPTRYTSPEALRAALERGGAGCETDQARPGLVERGGVVLCTSTGPGSDGTSYALVVWQGERPDVGAFDDGTRVEGTNWIVVLSAGNRAQGDRVRAAVGGTYRDR
ncbi:MAG TPA: hypothetical protein VNQ77_09640 [Frankiaceae bacterium]|nr:hypothetical protein [Frankiaceae bacterium]